MTETLQAPFAAEPPVNDGGNFAAAITDSSGRAIQLPGLGGGWEHQPGPATDPYGGVKDQPGFKMLQRAVSKHTQVRGRLSLHALRELEAGKPVDFNDTETWGGWHTHATMVLRRHGISRLDPGKLSPGAVRELIDGQRAADEAAGLDWGQLYDPPSRMDDPLAKAHRKLPIDLDHPGTWAYLDDKRRALARRLGLEQHLVEDLSRFVVSDPERFDPESLASWRIASASWFAVAREQIPVPEHVARPVGLFVTPAEHAGWQLSPALSLEMIMLCDSLGGQVSRDLCEFAVPGREKTVQLVQHINQATLTGRTQGIQTTAAERRATASRELGVTLTTGQPALIDLWGSLEVTGGRDWPGFAVVTRASRTFPRKLVGARRRTDWSRRQSATVASEPMDLGEAIGVAQDTGLPLLLSTEAAGQINGLVRVGRLKGRPGMVSITTAEGMAAVTRRMAIERGLGDLRALKRSGKKVIVDAGARQLIQMQTVKPLGDDPILLGRQQEVAALKVVGSGVDASQTAAGKTVSTGRALWHRAQQTPRFRGLLTAPGRLLPQWRERLLHGAGTMPALAPNLQVEIVGDGEPVAAQVRAFDRRVGDDAGLLMVPAGVLERFAPDLKVIHWHLLVADEGHHYTNPTTDGHRALRDVRMNAAADCWLLTATPKGKTAGDLDVLLGLAVGDGAMIDARIASRDAGDLLEEVNAHRLRAAYGPQLVRITRRDMKPWMPDILPAKALPIPSDPALQLLLDAIRSGGREAYRKLVRLMKDLQRLEKGSELYMQALAEIGRVQGQTLAAVGVYVDASVDPETLKHSGAIMAQALVRQGLVDAAIAGGGDGIPTLRGIVADTITKVSGEEQVLVFAERLNCLRQLSRTLADRHGVEARVVDGGVADEEFEQLKAAFRAGEFPVLCVGKVAAEGHDFQNASVIVHLDLPWTPPPLEQRVGRAGRIGSARDYVQTYIPYIQGGGIPYIVGILAPRGGEHHQILDGFEGVPVTESTLAGQLADVTGQVADAKEADGYKADAARLRFAAAVFGS